MTGTRRRLLLDAGDYPVSQAAASGLAVRIAELAETLSDEFAVTVYSPDVPDPMHLGGARLERRADRWRELRVGRTDNFFDLGGHSLLLLRVHARLVRELRLDLPVVTLFRYPTVEAIAAHLAGEEGPASGRPDLGQARVAGRDRLTRARARRGGTDDRTQEAVPLDETGTQP
ncbi:phosphopantetheine-binding protein [Micromonospora inyonensis]|uniref:Phosphopantetheine attachment site n=1 Tax=Micromonospora inyonensis TaxID=47866 RepID=A0A1C6SFJ2_9ACTN|nr:phosphopantetheine-binding protein [Micromonospora inyonensis]SCL28201.1 Phosphopantetheine attachment site [Micromonospora inyonensis]